MDIKLSAKSFSKKSKSSGFNLGIGDFFSSIGSKIGNLFSGSSSEN